jgi:hypothetical protein
LIIAQIKIDKTCPNCADASLWARLTAGREVPFRPFLDSNYTKCPACGSQWRNRFGDIKYVKPKRATTPTRFSLSPEMRTIFDEVAKSSQKAPPSSRPARPASPPRVALNDVVVLGVVEERQVEEEIGSEIYRFNNSRSSTQAVEHIMVSNRSSVSIQVSTEKITSPEAGASISFTGIGSVSAKVTATLRKQYAVTTQSELTHEQTTTITVPPRIDLKVIFHWKRIWQLGKARLGTDGRVVALVPYRVTVRLRFDKETVDVLGR